MRKRKAGRVGSRPGGLLPAVRPAERAAPSQTNAPTESWSLHYGKVEY